MEMRLKPWGDRLNPDRLSWDRGLIQIGDRCSSSPRESTLIRDRRQNPDGDRCPSVAILTNLGILHCLIDRFSGVRSSGQEQISDRLSRNPETGFLFRTPQITLDIHNRNPVSLPPRPTPRNPRNPETGFLFRTPQITLVSTTETRFLYPQDKPQEPRNRVSFSHSTDNS
jgi:hypothetical protein